METLKASDFSFNMVNLVNISILQFFISRRWGRCLSPFSKTGKKFPDFGNSGKVLGFPCRAFLSCVVEDMFIKAP